MLLFCSMFLVCVPFLHNWRGSYEDDKYGEDDKTWIKHDEKGVSQYNVKNVENGDHYFANIRTGAQGAALGDYRPSRDEKDDD